MAGLRRSLGVVVVLALTSPSMAIAEEERSTGTPGASYLWDGGALPFVWGALAARLTLDHYQSPRESPLLFDSGEGGAPRGGWETPGWGVTALGGVAMTGMLVGGHDARWYHVKGLAESLSTGVFVTGALKVTFGRHRPSWVEGDSSGERRSFPSGHSTQAFAIASYSILYLHEHVFAGKPLSGVEVAAYAGITTMAVGLAGERVVHHRHHLSDVVVGSLLGVTSSTLFYVYQEHRYRRRGVRERSLTVAPIATSEAVTVQLGFGW